jgi:hypothetical protein
MVINIYVYIMYRASVSLGSVQQIMPLFLVASASLVTWNSRMPNRRQI